jgi:hypothetical protein
VVGVTVVIIAIISGMFGGGITAVFLEVYLQRRADEVVGAYDLPDSHRAS